ncbi:MAG: hypothetical protein RLZZ618_1452 [Pseudomonadota bacterium]|jgi:hypothetical protein
MEAIFSFGGSTDWGGGGVDGGGGGGWSDGGGDIGGFDHAQADLGESWSQDYAQADLGESYEAGPASWDQPAVEAEPAEPENVPGVDPEKFGLPENADAQGFVLATEESPPAEQTASEAAADAPAQAESQPQAAEASETAAAPEEAVNWCPADPASGEAVDGPVKGSVTVRPGQGVLSALKAAGVPADKLNAAYGSLVASGQLKAGDFKNGIPVVQPGREFQLNSAEFTDKNAKLGGSLIGNEFAARVVADTAPVLALTHATPEERAADPNYQLMRDSQVRQNSTTPAAPAAMPEPRFADQYKGVLDGWDSIKDGLRAANEATALSDGGGLLTAAVAFTEAPRELGFSLVDAGLGLGGLAVDFTKSVIDGTVVSDATAKFGPILNSYAAIEDKQFRVSVGYKNEALGVDAKVMVGTDRFGIQYKTPGVVDEVGRFTYSYGDDAPKLEMMLEKNFDVGAKLPARIGGLPLKIEVVPGLRENATSGGTVTPSLNIEVSSPAFNGFKGAIEVRQSGS